MGFLDRLTGGGDDVDPAVAERQAQSLASIEAGGLPLNAQDRLRELAAAKDATFTSTLSVDEFALSHGLGLQPICQVMGSSIYKVGWQFTPWTSGQSGELTVQSQALNEARRLAVGRLYQEAQLAGADAVVGVRVERAEHDWVEDAIEFVAQGTAVRIPSAPTNGHPVLSDLSLQDFWKLRVAGYMPVGFVAASTVFYIVASWATRKAQSGFFSSWNNQELVDFTQGVYAARETVLAAMQAQAAYYRAEGVVGVQLEEEARPREVGSENNRRTDLVVTMHAIGTAIRATGGGRPITPRPTVSRGAA